MTPRSAGGWYGFISPRRHVMVAVAGEEPRHGGYRDKRHSC